MRECTGKKLGTQHGIYIVAILCKFTMRHHELMLCSSYHCLKGITNDQGFQFPHQKLHNIQIPLLQFCLNDFH